MGITPGLDSETGRFGCEQIWISCILQKNFLKISQNLYLENKVIE